MTRYHGKGGTVYMSVTGAGAAVPAVALSNWTLDFKRDRVETTAFGDPNKQFVQGLAEVSGSLSGFWDDLDDSLFDASESTDGIKMYLYPSSLKPTVYFYGPAWLDASIDTAVDGAIKLSGSFAANGAWSRKP